MVESSHKMRSTGEVNGKPLQYSSLENPMNSRKVEKDGRDDYATIWMYLMPLNCTGKTVKMITLILRVFSPMKKTKADISLTSFLCYFIYVFFG